MRAAVRLIWALDIRHLLAHRTRLALSVLGIAVGVALGVAVGSLSASIQGSLNAIAQAAASEANVEIRPNGRVGLAPDLLGRVRTVRGVQEAGATVESYVRLRRAGKTARVLALGVDTGVLNMAPRAVDVSEIRVADLFGLFVPEEVARELGVRAGQRVEITTPTGWRAVSVGAVLPHAATERSRVVVGTVGVLQQLLDRGGTYDAIYVKAADPDRTLQAVQRAVGDRGRAGPIAFRGQQIQQLLSGANAGFIVGTIVALFVGAFLVFNTMSMAAVERLREAALLRAVGAKRKQIFALFLSEGALLGVLGSALGAIGGTLLAGQLLSQRGGALEEIYPIQITRLEIDPALLVGAGAAGILVAIVAAWLPARRLARCDPAPALGPTGTFEDPTHVSRRRTNVVAAILAIAGPLLTFPAIRAGFGASSLAFLGMTMTMGGIALLIPTLIPALAGFLLAGITRLRRTPGVVRLAAGEVTRSPGRTAFTVGAMLLSLAIVVGFSIAQGSFTRAFDVHFKDIIAADLYVRSPTWQIFGSDVPLSADIADEIEAIPGVSAAWPFRLMPATIEGREGLVLAYDMDEYASFSRLEGAAGVEAREQARALKDPNAVLVSPSLLAQLSRRVGDTIAMPTPTGLHRLRIAGTLNDPAAINPEVIFDHDSFERVWGSGGADTFAVVTDTPQLAPTVDKEISRRLGRRYGLVVDSQAEYLNRLSGIVNSVQQLIGSVQLVAVIVAGLGLANTLLISTFERKRDLGVLRAVGMLRRQLRRMVAAEALLIGAVGVLCAWGLGTIIGLGMFGFTQAQLGVGLELVFPVSGYVGAAILGLGASIVASLYPAQRAARLEVVEALQYE